MTCKPNILVTGGAGFIGSHTCKALADAGYNPITLDDLSTGHEDAVKWGPIVKGDVRNTDLVQRILTQNNIVAVVHLAAKAYVGESMVEPASYYAANVGGTISLLQACNDAKVARIVFSSSCATYGIPEHLPISEAAAQNPLSPYGRTKLMCEQMIHDHGAAYGLQFVILRYFNAAGADPSGDLAERHDPETHLIPLALMAAYGQMRALTVFGTDYDTPDGTCIRDYIHVCDLARAHVYAVAHLLRNGPNLAVNLGSGHGYSILEIVTEIQQLTDRPIPMSEAPRRLGDPPALVADARVAARTLGFVTQRSDISSIVADAARRFQIDAVHANNN
ncbi:UDP-glucose 4-epimerase GalE [Roseicyclus marinus]|uniref:UDP-glucose 4-epimerase GalE n=1 Tax=Roseicyclus marinus TaxID=2161673 RepID=UPI00240F7A56|nr:UDP-glucose 4-epimerase GalE [Roseicyclus marinus]MDG3042765.1 UDP-glucose 4-epimerase GalE [Roseicyclus marinus]